MPGDSLNDPCPFGENLRHFDQAEDEYAYWCEQVGQEVRPPPGRLEVVFAWLGWAKSSFCWVYIPLTPGDNG